MCRSASQASLSRAGAAEKTVWDLVNELPLVRENALPEIGHMATRHGRQIYQREPLLSENEELCCKRVSATIAFCVAFRAEGRNDLLRFRFNP